MLLIPFNLILADPTPYYIDLFKLLRLGPCPWPRLQPLPTWKSLQPNPPTHIVPYIAHTFIDERLRSSCFLCMLQDFEDDGANRLFGQFFSINCMTM